MTHDSIGLGEDGPTHQPIETLCGLRAMPNILNFRPADGNEVSGCYIEAFKNTQGPSVLILTRQNLPHLENSLASNVKFGAYVIKQVDNPSLIIVATGSEVHLAISSAKKLDSIGIRTRVVSMPCMELFELQDLEYKKTVFSQGVAVLSVEVYAELGWSLYAHASVCMKSFGASAPIKDLMEKFGFVEENVFDKGRKLVEFYKGRVPEWKVVRPF